MPASPSAETALSLINDDTSRILGLTIDKVKVVPGQNIPKADAQTAPELSFSVSGGTYLVISLDLDAPFPSFGILGPILHWIQPGLKPEKAADGTIKLLYPGTPFIANYIGPAPPPWSAPHRYAFFVYKQPDGFDANIYAPAGGKKLGNWQRMRYDLESFEKKAKLGKLDIYLAWRPGEFP